MKQINYYFLTGLVLSLLSLTSCGDDDDTSLLSKTIDSSDGITIEMTWEVNGNANGEDYVDLDLYIDDTSVGDGYEFSSASGINTESEILSSSINDGEYYMGVYFYSIEAPTLTSATAYYSIKVYETGDPTNAITISGRIDDDVEGNDFAYAKAKFTKNGNKFTITELANTTEFGID